LHKNEDFEDQTQKSLCRVLERIITSLPFFPAFLKVCVWIHYDQTREISGQLHMSCFGM